MATVCITAQAEVNITEAARRLVGDIRQAHTPSSSFLRTLATGRAGASFAKAYAFVGPNNGALRCKVHVNPEGR